MTEILRHPWAKVVRFIMSYVREVIGWNPGRNATIWTYFVFFANLGDCYARFEAVTTALQTIQFF